MKSKQPTYGIVEKPIRSILKAISWRTTATIDTFIISYIITRSFKFAISIGVLEVFTKMALYYFHERAWGKIKIGREVAPPPPDYQI